MKKYIILSLVAILALVAVAPAPVSAQEQDCDPEWEGNQGGVCSDASVTGNGGAYPLNNTWSAGGIYREVLKDKEHFFISRYNDYDLRAYDIDTGDLLWRKAEGTYSATGIRDYAMNETAVFYTVGNHSLVAVDKDTGQELWNKTGIPAMEDVDSVRTVNVGPNQIYMTYYSTFSTNKIRSYHMNGTVKKDRILPTENVDTGSDTDRRVMLFDDYGIMGYTSGGLLYFNMSNSTGHQTVDGCSCESTAFRQVYQNGTIYDFGNKTVAKYDWEDLSSPPVPNSTFGLSVGLDPYNYRPGYQSSSNVQEPNNPTVASIVKGDLYTIGVRNGHTFVQKYSDESLQWEYRVYNNTGYDPFEDNDQAQTLNIITSSNHVFVHNQSNVLKFTLDGDLVYGKQVRDSGSSSYNYWVIPTSDGFIEYGGEGTHAYQTWLPEYPVYYNNKTLIVNNVNAEDGVQSWSRPLKESDHPLSNLSIEPDVPLNFTVHQWKGGSTYLSGSYYAEKGGSVTFAFDNVDYQNISYVVTYRNGEPTYSFFPQDDLKDGSLNYNTGADGYDIVSVIAPRIDSDDSITPICENTTITTNDKGQVISVSNETAFQECVDDSGDGTVTASGGNVTGSTTNETTIIYSSTDGNMSFDYPEFGSWYQTDKVTIPRPDPNESNVRAYVGGEYVLISRENVSIGVNGSATIHEWEDPNTTYDISSTDNVTTNETQTTLRGDVVILPGQGDFDVIGDGNLTLMQEVYYLNTRMRVSGPGIIEEYIDEPSGKEVGDVSFNSFGGEVEFTITEASRAKATQYGARVLELKVHSVTGVQNTFSIGGLGDTQRYTVYRGGEKVVVKNATESGDLSFDTEEAGTYRVVAGGSPGLNAVRQPPGGGIGGLPPWWLIVLALAIAGGGIYWYRKTRKKESSPA